MTLRERRDLAALLRETLPGYKNKPGWRARKALRMVADGYNYRETADVLGVGLGTVRYYVEMYLAGYYKADARLLRKAYVKVERRMYRKPSLHQRHRDWEAVLRGVANGFWSMVDASALMGVGRTASYAHARRAIIGVSFGKGL